MKNLTVFFLLSISFQLKSQGIEALSLTNAYNREMVSIGQYGNPTVIIFTTNECPFDNYYKSRVKELVSTYQGRVQFLLVNSSPDDQESIEKMAIHYSDVGIPYLADKDQKAMEALGARKSPEVFLLKPEGGKFTTQYSGAIDDNPQVASDVKQAYLKDAIEKLIKDIKIEVNNNRAVGCSIRKK